MQMTILECDPFHLVPLSVTDVHFVKALQADSFGSRCPDHATNCQVADAEQLVRSSLRNQDDLGVSKWKLVSADGAFGGWAGFTPVSETSEISLNYCLSNRVLEQDGEVPRRLCKALADWFFKETYFSHLVAVVRTDDCTMRNVMLDTGFCHREGKVIGGMQADLFQMLSPSMQTYLMSA